MKVHMLRHFDVWAMEKTMAVSLFIEVMALLDNGAGGVGMPLILQQDIPLVHPWRRHAQLLQITVKLLACTVLMHLIELVQLCGTTAIKLLLLLLRLLLM